MAEGAKLGILEMVVGSSVLAAVVSGVVSVIISMKSNNLQYITSERQQWRKEIRELVEEIEKADTEKKLCPYLTKLKVRINGYGYLKHKEYEHDSHIWDLILCIERQGGEETDLFLKERDLLILYLTVLLKYDWEEQKWRCT